MRFLRLLNFRTFFSRLGVERGVLCDFSPEGVSEKERFLKFEEG
jgi:hypothetical protein